LIARICYNDIIIIIAPIIDFFLLLIGKFLLNIDFLGVTVIMRDMIYEGVHDKRTDLYVFSTLYKKGMNCCFHFHRSFELIYILDGELTTYVNEDVFECAQNDIVFVQKFYTHKYQCPKDCPQLVFIIPPALCDDIDKSLTHNTLPARLDDKEFNQSLFPIIKTLHEERESMPKLVKCGYVNVLMGRLIQHYQLVPLQSNGNINLLVRILNYIDDNYEKEITLDLLSETFGYNKYYFSRLFNRYIGENLNNYVNVLRLQKFIEHSKNKKTASNITELAYEVGFDSLSTFYRCFRKVYGKNPKDFLKN